MRFRTRLGEKESALKREEKRLRGREGS